jgi:hypothetical protein
VVERKVNGIVLVPCNVVVPVITKFPVVPKFNVVLAVVLPAVKLAKVVVAFREMVEEAPDMIRLVVDATRVPLLTVREPLRFK